MYSEMSLLEKALKFSRLLCGTYAFPPKDICIEVSTQCNESCGVCFKFPLGIVEKTMPLEDFKKIFDRILRSFAGKPVRYLTFVGMGEVFCNEDLLGIIQYARDKAPGMAINLSTNLTCFKEAVVRRLILEGLINLLSVSIDDVVPLGRGYHNFTPSLKENLQMVLRLRAEYNPGLMVRIQTLILSKEQVIRMIDTARVLNIDLLQLMRLDLHVFKGRSVLTRIDEEEEKRVIDLARAYAAQCDQVVLYNNSYGVFREAASRQGEICLLTDDHLFIDVDGNVLPCFFLRDYRIGNLLQEPLESIYLKKVQRDFYKSQVDVCCGCDVYKVRHRH